MDSGVIKDLGRDEGARASDTLGRKGAMDPSRSVRGSGWPGTGMEFSSGRFHSCIWSPSLPPGIYHILNDMYFLLHLKEPPAAWPVARLGAVWTGLHRQPK